MYNPRIVSKLSILSTHGLQLLGRPISKTKLLWTMWLVCFLASATLLGCQINRVASIFLTYPTQVDIKVLSNPTIKFPAVTFCSLGIVSKQIVSKIPTFKNIALTMTQVSSTTNARKKRYSNIDPIVEIPVNVETDVETVKTYGNIFSSTPESLIDAEFLNTNLTATFQDADDQSSYCNESSDSKDTDGSPFDLLIQTNLTIPTATLLPSTDICEISGPTKEHSADINKQPDVAEQAEHFIEDIKSRPVRSVAYATCSGHCLPTNTNLPATSAFSPTLADCAATCVPMPCESFSYEPASLSCYRYATNCCTYLSYHSTPTTFTTYVIGLCDALDTTTGSLSTGPYIQDQSYIFTCSAGYLDAVQYSTNVATKTYSCLPTGIWSPTFVPCTAYCNSIFLLTTGAVNSVAPYMTGTTVIFTCTANPLYLTSTKQPTASYVCSGSPASWNIAFQPCIAHCADIFSLTTGTPSPTPGPYVTGTTVTFTCTTSPLYLSSTKQATSSYSCSGTPASWSAAFQPCLAYCTDIFALATGTPSPTPAPYVTGTVVTFTCTTTPLYLTVAKLPSDSYTCSGTPATWSKAFQACKAVCANIFTTATGTPNSTAPYLTPTDVNFICSTTPQYLTHNNQTYESYSCTGPPAVWDKQFISCIQACVPIVRAQIAINIAWNQVTVANVYPSGTTGIFSCIDGYTIRLPVASPQTTCTSGTWDVATLDYPYCLANCLMLDTTQFFARLMISYSDSLNATVVAADTVGTFSCNNSYFMYGDYNFTTCINGTWDHAYKDFPICLEEAVPLFDEAFLMSLVNESARADNLAAGAALADVISYIWANMSESMKYSLGFSQKDNELGCTYDGRPCGNDEIHGIQDPSLGNCYTFNHEYLNPTLETSHIGAQFGLHWIFDTKQEDFISVLATAGIKLIIHQQLEPLFVDAMGFTVSPGYTYHIEIRKELQKKLNTPTSNCLVTVPNQYFFTNRSYRAEGCIRSALQSRIIQSCGCGSPHLPMDHSGSFGCGLANRTCVETEIVSANDNLKYDCPQPCMDMEEHRLVTISTNVPYDVAYSRNNFTAEYVKNNVVAIRVYYHSLDYFVYEETISYTILNMVSDVGSSLGLLLGMSVISLVELITLPFRLAVK